jgi:hypothetical protein
VAIESAAGGVPQDVEWAVARDRPFPDSVYILQHRPETTWTTSPAASPAASPAVPESGPVEGGSVAAPAPEPDKPAFDPVQYALRNVFKVPGT